MTNENNKMIERVSNALGLITFGFIALLVTLGIVPMDNIWNFFFKFWPIFVIFGGLKLFIGAFSFGKIANLIVDILFNVVLVLSFMFLPTIESKLAQNFEMFNTVENTTVAEELNVKSTAFTTEDVEDVNFVMDIGAINFTVTDKDSPEYLVTTGTYNKEIFEPKIFASTIGKTLNLKFEQKSTGSFRLGNFRNAPSNLDFVLGNTNKPLNLDIDLGAGKGNIELTNTKIKGITLNVGAGDLALTLPANQAYVFKYDVGAGKVKIYKDGETLKEVAGLSSNSTFEYGSSPVNIVDINVGAGKIDIYLK